MTTVRWVTAPHELLSAWAPGSGLIPVLSPSDAGRRERWQEILSWYLRSSHEPAAVPPPAAVTMVVYAPDYLELVRRYADAVGHRIVLPAGSDLGRVDPQATATARRCVLIGRYADFTVPALMKIDAEMTMPWSIIAAQDLAGLSFQLAKSVLSREMPPQKSSLWIDAMKGRARVFCADEGDAEHVLEQAAMPAILEDTNWQDVAIHAHGRGGHCNLGQAVLCGLPGDQECGANGDRVRGGCTAGPPRVCKRGPPDTKVVHTSRIRARGVYLFACVSSLVPGELYPGDVSHVAALAEGYAASGLRCSPSRG